MRTILSLIIAVLIFQGCAGGRVADKPDRPEEPPSFIVYDKKIELSFDEQQKKAFEKFNEILEVSQEEGRLESLDRMARLYIEIINEYPDAHLAQESYMRLISMFLVDFNPPRERDAMDLDRYHKKRYPDSPLRNAIEESIMRYYYGKARWKALIDYVTPKVKEFIQTGELKTPVYLFYFSEAKFNLNDYKEAYKGYKIIIKRFPKSRDTRTAVKRIVTIKTAVEKEKREGR